MCVCVKTQKLQKVGGGGNIGSLSYYSLQQLGPFMNMYCIFVRGKDGGGGGTKKNTHTKPPKNNNMHTCMKMHSH